MQPTPTKLSPFTVTPWPLMLAMSRGRDPRRPESGPGAATGAPAVTLQSEGAPVESELGKTGPGQEGQASARPGLLPQDGEICRLEALQRLAPGVGQALERLEAGPEPGRPPAQSGLGVDAGQAG